MIVVVAEVNLPHCAYLEIINQDIPVLYDPMPLLKVMVVDVLLINLALPSVLLGPLTLCPITEKKYTAVVDTGSVIVYVVVPVVSA